MSDDLPERAAKRLTILPLDALGVKELQDYIEELRTEIARADAMIARKQDHRTVADMVFGKPKGAG